MKRKPVRDSFTTDELTINGTKYEIAHFDSEPYINIEEFRLYRNKKKLTTVLRTISDWNTFWQKIDFNASGCKIRDLEWSILFSCIMGYRAGFWIIPELENLSVEEKCKWINSHNSSSKKFKESDWKNARRPDRQVNMLPKNILENKLMEMGAIM